MNEAYNSVLHSMDVSEGETRASQTKLYQKWYSESMFPPPTQLSSWIQFHFEDSYSYSSEPGRKGGDGGSKPAWVKHLHNTERCNLLSEYLPIIDRAIVLTLFKGQMVIGGACEINKKIEKDHSAFLFDRHQELVCFQ